MFSAYFRPSQEEYDRLWREGIFVFDANVLLNFYRITSKARGEAFAILTQLGDRLWLPNQAVLEYVRNRPEAISKPAREVGAQATKLEKTITDISYALNNTRPALVELAAVVEPMLAAVALLKRGQNSRLDLLSDDTIEGGIERLFAGKIGYPYSQEKLGEIHREGEQRFKKEIPPGYRDAKKTGDQAYGDLIIWYQIIDRAKEQQRPVILITDDGKEDWWWTIAGRKLGPQPELLTEFRQETGMPCYIYTFEQFLKRAQKYLSLPDDQVFHALQQAGEIRQQEEMAEAIEKARAVDLAFATRLTTEPAVATRSASVIDEVATDEREAGTVRSEATPAMPPTSKLSAAQIQLSLGRMWGEAWSAQVADALQALQAFANSPLAADASRMLQADYNQLQIVRRLWADQAEGALAMLQASIMPPAVDAMRAAQMVHDEQIAALINSPVADFSKTLQAVQGAGMIGAARAAQASLESTIKNTLPRGSTEELKVPPDLTDTAAVEQTESTDPQEEIDSSVDGLAQDGPGTETTDSATDEGTG